MFTQKHNFGLHMSTPAKKQSAAYSLHNKAGLVHGGKEYFTEMERLVRSARHSVHLQIYIFDEDETGMRMADALKDAARRGVDVFLLLDGYASRKLSDAFVDGLKSSGIRFRYFEHLFHSDSFYFGRRLHHKVLVVDARYALVGGLNVSDRYNDLPGQPAWLDWAIMTEGEVSFQLFRICVAQYVKSREEAGRIIAAHPIPETDASWHCPVRIRRNDWVTRKSQISRSYLSMFRSADREIIIMSSYFLPGRVFRKHMRQAVQRGVKFRLILAGVSDVVIAKQAERYMYRWLIRNGIEIHEYRRNVLHGKIAVRDSRWVTAGSYNVNNISAYASVELNLDVDDEAFGQQVRRDLMSILERDCVAVTAVDYRTRYGLFQRFLQFASYEIFRMVFFLFTFYFKQR